MTAPTPKHKSDKPRERRKPSWSEQASDIITAKLEALTERTMELHFERRSELESLYSPRQRAYYFKDTRHNLTTLAAAILLETPDIFGDNTVWLKHLLEARGIPTGGLKDHFECMRDALAEILPSELWVRVSVYVETGLQRLEQLSKMSNDNSA